MATSYPTLSVPTGWTDIAALEPGIASVPGVRVQNVGQDPITVFFGGTSEPTDDLDGHVLGRFSEYPAKDGAANIWVKGPGSVSLSVTDDGLTTVDSKLDDLLLEITAVKDAVQAPLASLPNPALTDVSGMTFVPFDHNTAAAHIVLSAGTLGETIKVYGILLTFAAEVDITLGGGAAALPLVMKTPGFDLLPRVGGLPLYVTAADTALTLTLGSAVRVAGGFWVKKSIPA